MPYPGTPARPRCSSLDRSLHASALAAVMVLAAGCTAAEETPVGVLSAPLGGCADAGDGPRNGVHITLDDLLEAMVDDLRAVDEVDREDVRYVTLAHLHNRGASSACMDTYRAAMNLTLNSVSRGRRPVAAVPVDGEATVFRIELEDHGWDAATWQQLVTGYPYNVRHDADSELFPVDAELAVELRADTASAVPYVQGDWLVSAAMQPPLYYDLLGLPATFEELEDQLGIDTVAATDEGSADRAGFVRSGVSTASRMIARYGLPGAGVLWTSCDVDPRGAGETILTEPLEPICESHEIVFRLPNGLPAYFIADPTTGARQDASPRSLVTDPGRADGRVVAGVSCAGCHSQTGIITRRDEVRDQALANGADDLDAILGLYPSQSEMRRLVEADQRGFAGARRGAGVPDAIVAPITWVSAEHARALGPDDAAASLGITPDILGITPDMFALALDHSVAQLPVAASVLRQPDGRIGRETWDQIYGDVVEALGLGAPCDPAGCD
jgi:hypothetical protein